MYSTTYTLQTAQLISTALALLNIQVDSGSVETAVTVVLTIAFGLAQYYHRYKQGDVTALGFYRK